MSTDNIDPRIKLLSYSSLLTLHSCPRKFELYRKKATEDVTSPEAECNQNVTFAYGHVVGDGIQQLLSGKTLDQVIFSVFLGWHADLEDRNDKQAKSFYLAVYALQRFSALLDSGYLEEYEVLEYNGKPACELSFSITFPDNFVLRGSVDAVLRHKVTGKVIILECKTSSATNLMSASYKNSAQGVGYSVVLDVICPQASSYEVLYLVYLTKQREYEVLTFPKTYLQRARWIQELLLDIETIKMYENVNIYPMRGESCTDFYRECEYFNQCHLSTQYLITPYNAEAHKDTKVYDITLTLTDLLNAQIANTIPAPESELVITSTGDLLL